MTPIDKEVTKSSNILVIMYHRAHLGPSRTAHTVWAYRGYDQAHNGPHCGPLFAKFHTDTGCVGLPTAPPSHRPQRGLLPGMAVYTECNFNSQNSLMSTMW